MKEKEYQIENPIECLKNEIINKYDELSKIYLDDNHNISRGHIESISYKFENCFAEAISNLLGDEFKIYIDYTLEGGRRPDIIITKKNSNGEVIKAIIELKTNLGYCRNDYEKIKASIENVRSDLKAKKEVNITLTRQERLIKEKYQEIFNMMDEKKKQAIEKRLDEKIEKSIEFKQKLKIGDEIKYMLVVLTSSNISKNELDKYYTEFKDKENFCVLFDGWYYDLKERKDDINKLNNFIENI